MNRKSKLNLLAYKSANDNSLSIDWSSYQSTKPAFLGTKVFEKYPLKTLINYIDWTPFFITWQLAGKYPDILNDKTVGKAATDLFNDAQKLLKKL